MIVLDTNVLSEVFRPSPDARVVAWLEQLTGEVATDLLTGDLHVDRAVLHPDQPGLHAEDGHLRRPAGDVVPRERDRAAVEGAVRAGPAVPAAACGHQPQQGGGEEQAGAVRADHPNRSAPRCRHSTRRRWFHGRPPSGLRGGSLRSRSATGSTPAAPASSSMATSSAWEPGISPGARIHEGTATSSRASRWLVRRCSPAYIIRVMVAVCSANSWIVEVCENASCAIAVSRPSASVFFTSTVVPLRQVSTSPSLYELPEGMLSVHIR